MKVPAQWPRKLPARLAFLGEAPGADELDKGRQRRESRASRLYPHYLQVARQLHPELPWSADRNWWEDYKVAEELPPYPLVGASGDVFNPALAQLNLTRADVWVGNVFEEKAPGNNVAPWLRDKVRMAEVRERLAGELAACGANVIVPLGGTALAVLTGRSDISKAAGAPVLATEVVPGAKLLPNYHPAYILRQWKMLTIFQAGLERALREADAGPELKWPWRELTLEPDLEEIRRWVHAEELEDSRGDKYPSLRSSECQLLSTDIETGWGMITCIGFAPDHLHSIVIPFVDLRQPSKSYWPDREAEWAAWELVKTACESPRPKLGQNFPYDAQWLLEKQHIRVMNYREDTRLMSHALYPELPKGLGTLIALYSECPQTKHWGEHGGEEKRDA